MDLRFLSYHYAPLKVIGLVSMNSFTKTRESEPFSRMLVFEYASNGTLFDVICFLPLDGEAAQFSWLRRMKIAIGIAQGLRYLHTESQPPFAISELNSNSVYVTEDFTPKMNTL
ncbi:unnamed protein product [Triticum turgidum subsp. durum]|uniref:Protein kinase domain-containing protein n=1 Tax=Triticum turgidum subsp. durum TaxID=4567 RepID=A0A9R1REU1_TRITD|nr:unnamed protein product [Triticum turgidum subsp. durum]